MPAKTPDEIANRLSAVFFKAMALPEIQELIDKVGVIAHPTGPEAARKQMDSELASFGTIMKELGIIQ